MNDDYKFENAMSNQCNASDYGADEDSGLLLSSAPLNDFSHCLEELCLISGSGGVDNIDWQSLFFEALDKLGGRVVEGEPDHGSKLNII